MIGSLRERINTELKDAMKSQSKRRISTLRLINAAVKDREIQDRGASSAGGMSDGEIEDILVRMIKQRRESAKVYDQGGRPELADGEREEIAVIEEFLPRQMTPEEIQAAIQQTLSELGCEGLKNMGLIMNSLKEKYAKRMDFSKASAMVKKMLA